MCFCFKPESEYFNPHDRPHDRFLYGGGRDFPELTEPSGWNSLSLKPKHDGMKVDVDGMKLSTDHVIRRAAKHQILAGQVESLKDMLVRSSA